MKNDIGTFPGEVLLMTRSILKKIGTYFTYAYKKYLSKIRYQFIILLIISCIIPILIMQVINYSLANKMFMQQNASILEDNLSTSKIKADNVFLDYQKLIYKIYTDETFIRYIEAFNKIEDENSIEYTVACDNLKNCIGTHVRLHPEVRSIGIYGKNEKTFLIEDNSKENQHIIDYFNSNSKNLFQHIESQKTSSLGLITSESSYYQQNNPIFYIKHRTLNHENMKYLGGIILFISQDTLNQAINSETSSCHEFSKNYILSEEEYILSSKDQTSGLNFNEINPYNSSLDKTKEINTYEDDKIKITRLKLSYFNLSLISIVDKTVFLHDLNTLRNISFLLIGFILLLAIIIANIVSKRVIKSIERMSHMMNTVNEDNLNVFIQSKSNNEIRDIETSFNYMVSRIIHLLDENKEQYEHIMKISLEAHKAELKFLELQINPHFLFNTIDSINWLAIREGYDDISYQLNNLAWILRHTIHNVNDLVPLSSEIDILKCYLELQKHRFQNFEYDIFINHSIEHLKIHKLILQPFIENSILHGFENISWRGYIRIYFSIIQQKYLMIKILDNGIGIPPEKLRKINELFRYKRDTNLGIGLSNIALRLASYYQDRIKVYARSNTDETCFTLYFPLDVLQGE